MSRTSVCVIGAHVAKKEGYAIEPSAAELLALIADGSYRDALSVLEKTLAASTDKKLSREEAERATGAPKHALVQSFLAALSKGTAGEALSAIRKASDAGVDLELYLMLVLEAVRATLLIRYAPELREELSEEYGSDVYEEYEKLAADASSKLSHDTLKILLDAASRMRYAPVPALPLELAVYELASDGTQA